MLQPNPTPLTLGLIAANPELLLRTFQCLTVARRKAHVILPIANPWISAFRRSRYCHGVHELDLKSLCQNPTAAIQPIQSLCDRLGINLLIPADLPLTILLATLRDHLPGLARFPSLPPNQIRQLGNKLCFASLLRHHDLPQPDSWPLTCLDQIPSLPCTYPVIVKPPDLEASKGIKVCHTPDEVTRHAQSLACSPDHPLQVQQFIPGHDIDISFLANHGTILAWTINTRSSPTQTNRLASCRYLDHPAFLQTGQRLAHATRYHGVAHIDARLDPRDGLVKLIECNPRMWGSVHYSPFAGVNFVEAGIALATHQPLNPATTLQRPGVVNLPSATLRLLLNRSESIPVWTSGTRKAWCHMLRDPLPWLLSRRLRS